MRFLRIVSFFLLLALGLVSAQMTPNAPVKDFRFPRFGETGYTQWVLQGVKGIYENEEQMNVEGMALRVYSGDERMAIELTLSSPEATLRLEENRAFSDSSIDISGANFEISGTGWEWSGETKEIVVKNDTVVEFTQGIAGAFVTTGSVESTSSTTMIRSQRLVLRTTEDEYYFEFTGDVDVTSDQMNLKSQQLIALADPPKGRKNGVNTVAPGQLDSIRQITAREEVVIVQEGKTVKADQAEFLPRERMANLDGATSVSMEGAYITGETIRTRAGEIVIAGTPEVGRAQMILTETGGLGIQGASALDCETIVLADIISMREVMAENHFLFNGSVEVMSGAVQMRSNDMQIVANKSAPNGQKKADDERLANDSQLKVGEVKYIVADGGVHIVKSGQIATGEKVTFYPAEEKAILTGNPKVTNGDAVVTGRKMELKPKLAIISGDGSESVVVRLPEMQDLGYEAYTPASATSSKSESDAKVEETVVKSRLLRMIEEPQQTLFRFTNNVVVTATNLDATCDRLDVITMIPNKSAAKVAAPLELQRIEAHQNVVFKQSGRIATAQKVFILPKEGEVILEGQAVINDESGKVSGHRMILHQGERRAVVEGGGPDGERARITLPGLPAGN